MRVKSNSSTSRTVRLPQAAMTSTIATIMMRRIIPITSLLLSRTSMIFLPVAVFLDLRNPYIYTAIILIYSLFAPFVTNTWTAAMVEIINNKERGKYFGKRNFFISISSIFFTLIYGIFLAMPDKKTGYFILFISFSILLSSERFSSINFLFKIIGSIAFIILSIN